MNLEEKLKAFKEKGWTYDKHTGDIFSHTGRIIDRINNHGYIACSLSYQRQTIAAQAHQLGYYLATDEVPNVIDHINHIKTDNRFENLRNGTQQKNQWNRQAVGYSWHKHRNKWYARIVINKKPKHLGAYTTEEDAKQAYLEAKKIYHII